MLFLSEVGMAWGIPHPSFLEVPDLFSLLDSPRNRFYHSSDPRVLAKIPRGPRTTHYIIKELAHFAKEMVTNKWKGNEMGINKWITKRKWESTSEIRIVVFFGFPNLDMMDRKSDNQTSSRTTRSARPWCGWKDFVRFSIHHTLKLKFRSVF